MGSDVSISFCVALKAIGACTLSKLVSSSCPLEARFSWNQHPCNSRRCVGRKPDLWGLGSWAGGQVLDIRSGQTEGAKHSEKLGDSRTPLTFLPAGADELSRFPS